EVITIIKNILISGAAGQGIDTVAGILEEGLFKAGFHVFSNKDYMSRVRGGNNFIQIRFASDEVYSHSNKFDYVIPLDTVAYNENKALLNQTPFIMDLSLKTEDHKNILAENFKLMAKEAGNEKAITSSLIGYLWKLYGLDLDILEETINRTFSEKLAEVNISACRKGYEAPSVENQIQSKGTSKDFIFINGNQAIAFGALMAGCKFYSAYPMTPSTSVMNELALYAEKYPIIVEQAEDEIAAINMAIGSSFAGVRSMTGTSGGGFSLMVEGLGLAGISETPLVIVDSQRPGPATGFATRTAQGDLSFVLTASQGEFPRVVLAPKDQEDCFSLSFKAFDIGDKYQVPVFIMTDQYLSDARKTIEAFDPDDFINKSYLAELNNIPDYSYERYKLNESGISPRIYPGQYDNQIVLQDSYEHDEKGHDTESAFFGKEMMDKRMKKLNGFEKDIMEPEILGIPYSEIMIVSWGSTYGSLKEAIKKLNDEDINIFALHFNYIWPLPQKHLEKFSSRVKKIITVEHNYTGQLAKLIKQETGISVTDKITGYDGRQMSPEEIYTRLKEVL
ncbi:MAG: 2-oxoacid:acceptor oxidoreductase subunit alpha, partial [Eubacteriales bacterium]|nr:2-oxoacid:acceptor oxidoreductase subunit alpha [Eubacteriales bacterium]